MMGQVLINRPTFKAPVLWRRPLTRVGTVNPKGSSSTLRYRSREAGKYAKGSRFDSCVYLSLFGWKPGYLGSRESG